jgi:hypothetical protein
VGAACFGLVVGWITYRTLRRREGAVLLSDIATVIGVVGGGVVTGLFHRSAICMVCDRFGNRFLFLFLDCLANVWPDHCRGVDGRLVKDTAVPSPCAEASRLSPETIGTTPVAY